MKLIPALIGSLALGCAIADAANLPIPAGYPTLLGVSCGGVKVTPYVVGFATNFNLHGELFATTTCGGSGRGGGYHSTTYTSWHSIEWDWYGNYIVLPYDNGTPVVMAVDGYGDTASVVNGAVVLTGSPPPGSVALLVTVPNVVSMTTANATAAITALGLVPVISYYTYPTTQPGTVLNEVPSAGTGVSAGSDVTLIVRRNPN